MSQSGIETSLSSTQRRSRAGCERCRRRRQKCDETRPNCGRCYMAGVRCLYAINLRWGGRDFGRSRFGACQVRTIESAEGSFVYSVQERPHHAAAVAEIHGSNDFRSTQKCQLSINQSVPSFPPDLEPELQQLWHYFIHGASATISCHKQMQAETCRVLLSMAFESSALCHTILAFSSATRASRTEDESSRVSLKRRAASLKTKSIGCLHREITLAMNTRPETIFATCIMLCLCALCHENEDYNSWRIHLTGARATIPAVRALGSVLASQDSSIFFLQRRYALLEVVASLTPNGFQAQDLECVPNTPSQSSNVVFDDYCGCYSDVLDILHRIGAVALQRRRQEHRLDGSDLFSKLDFKHEAAILEFRLLGMIGRDESARPIFAPGFDLILEEIQALEFAYCNLICEYAALIYIRTQIQNLEPKSMEVQQPLRRIIDIARQLEPSSGLSPVLGLNTALYIAGRHAFGADREAIQELLLTHYRTSHNYNMVKAVNLLDQLWRQGDSEQINIEENDFIAW